MLTLFTFLAILLILLGMAGAYLGALAPALGVLLAALGLLLLALLFFAAIMAVMKHGTKGTSWLAFFLGFLSLCLLGAAGYFHYLNPIKDITTDVSNPPKFLHPLYPFRVEFGAELLDKSLQVNRDYNPADAATQRMTYPGFEGNSIKAPAKDTFAVAMQVVKAQLPHWKVVLEDPERLHAEMEVTWPPFMITDDVAIDVRPDPASQLDSRIEVRSRSRFGIGDFGLNIYRLRDLKVRLLLNLKELEDKFQVQRMEAEKKTQASNTAALPPNTATSTATGTAIATEVKP